MWEQGKGLNIRPFPPALRHDLRELAADAGKSLYEYVTEALAHHVKERKRLVSRWVGSSASSLPSQV